MSKMPIHFTRENQPSPQSPSDMGENRKHLGLCWVAIKERAELPKSCKTAFNSGAISRGVQPHTQGHTGVILQL